MLYVFVQELTRQVKANFILMIDYFCYFSFYVFVSIDLVQEANATKPSLPRKNKLSPNSSFWLHHTVS